MNYTELKAAIQDYLEDDETTFVSHLDDFIRLGEKRVYMALRLPAQRKHTSLNFTASDPLLTVATDVLAIISVAVVDGSNNEIYLLRKEEQFIREAYPLSTTTGPPAYYAVYDDDQILVAPTPGSALAVKVIYDGFPDSIVDNATTWLGDNLDRLLLYSCLLEGYIYMKGDEDLIATYRAEFQEELEKASLKVMGMGYGMDEVRRGAA